MLTWNPGQTWLELFSNRKNRSYLANEPDLIDLMVWEGNESRW